MELHVYPLLHHTFVIRRFIFAQRFAQKSERRAIVVGKGFGGQGGAGRRRGRFGEATVAPSLEQESVDQIASEYGVPVLRRKGFGQKIRATRDVLGPGLEYGTVTEAFAAGSRELRIQAAGSSAIPKLRGRLLTETGEPVPGINVSSYLSPVQEQIQMLGGSAQVTRFFMGPSTRSAEDGSFEFGPLLGQHLSFWIA